METIKETSQKKTATRKRSKIDKFGLEALHKKGKNFVLDTNVLLHDPGCLNRFSDNHICITTDVLSELDKFKGEQSERGANARRVHRQLSEMFTTGSEVTKGVKTEGGGSIRLVIYDSQFCDHNHQVLEQFLRVFPDQERVDHRILACTLLVAEYNKSKVVLITKDLNMQLKAKAVGIHCEDYLNDKVEVSEVCNYEMARVEVDPQELQAFATTGELNLPHERRVGIILNQYVYLQAGEKQTMPARLAQDGQFVRLQIPPVLKMPDGGHHLKPLNIGQKCLIDALLNPDISLVTCYGQAGTGKTLVAIAAGLHEMFNRQYNGITISRPVVAMGESLGFLPGDLDDKMRPWLQPVYDALELLMEPPAAKQGPRRKQGKKEDKPEPKVYESLVEQGIIEVEALCYIRGRSIPNRFFVLDEAQQLTPQEAKTIVTRMSRGSKLVLVGDPAQIDNPYVDSRSNGLVYTRNRLKGQEFVAHVALSKGERSPLAEAGAQLM